MWCVRVRVRGLEGEESGVRMVNSRAKYPVALKTDARCAVLHFITLVVVVVAVEHARREVNELSCAPGGQRQ